MGRNLDSETETELDREIREDLAKERARKNRSVKILNLVGLFVALLLLFVLYEVPTSSATFRFRVSLVALILAIVSSIGRRSWWK